MGDYGPHRKVNPELSKGTVKHYIDQLPKHRTEQLWITGGEPTLYRPLLDVIDYASKKREETGFPRKIGMTTNSSWADTVDNAIDTLIRLKASGLDDIYLSYDQFRTKKDRETVEGLHMLFASKQTSGDEQELYNHAMPKIGIQQNIKIAPIGRGANLPKELWYKNHDEKKMCCTLDKWAMYTWHLDHKDVKVPDEVKMAPVADVTPFGLSACASLPDIMTMGKLGEDLNVIPERMQKMSKLLIMMSLVTPKEAVKPLRKHIDLPELEDDCQICQHLFEKVDRKELERLCEDKTIEGTLEEFRLERALAFGHS